MANDLSYYKTPDKTQRIIYLLMGLGLLTLLTGLFAAPERTWVSYLIVVYYLTGLGMAGLFFIAIQYVAKAGWSVAIRRVPEAMAATLPVAAVGVLALFLGLHTLYEWSHDATVAVDPILREKSGWLNPSFFMIRLTIYFVIWIAFSRVLIGNSVRQDTNADLLFTRRNVRNSALFILIGVYTYCLASYDLIMSLQPHWYSTMFGFLNIAGMFQSGLAMIILLIVLLRKRGYTNIFTTVHLYTLGCLLLAFSIFWVYLWVSQHMLIWYANIPEETSYYIFRHFGAWGTLSFLNVCLNWLIPFFILLPRATKRNDTAMAQVALIILIGRWLDLYIMVAPPVVGAVPAIGLWEIGLALGMTGVFGFSVTRALSRHRLVPVNDPYLVESLPVAAEHGR